MAVDRIFGITAKPPGAVPQVSSFGAGAGELGVVQPLRGQTGITMPEMNPFGQISPAITNDKVAQRLPRLYA